MTKKKFETAEVHKVHIQWLSGSIETIWMLGANYDYLSTYILHYNMSDLNEPFTIITYYRNFEELKEKKELEAYININNIEKVVDEYQGNKE